MAIRSNIEKLISLEKMSAQDLRKNKTGVRRLAGSLRGKRGDLQLKLAGERARATARKEDNRRRVAHEREKVGEMLQARFPGQDKTLRRPPPGKSS